MDSGQGTDTPSHPHRETILIEKRKRRTAKKESAELKAQIKK